jgi:hypothetical protein
LKTKKKIKKKYNNKHARAWRALLLESERHVRNQLALAKDPLRIATFSKHGNVLVAVCHNILYSFHSFVSRFDGDRKHSKAIIRLKHASRERVRKALLLKQREQRSWTLVTNDVRAVASWLHLIQRVQLMRRPSHFNCSQIFDGHHV